MVLQLLAGAEEGRRRSVFQYHGNKVLLSPNTTVRSECSINSLERYGLASFHHAENKYHYHGRLMTSQFQQVIRSPLVIAFASRLRIRRKARNRPSGPILDHSYVSIVVKSPAVWSMKVWRVKSDVKQRLAR